MKKETQTRIWRALLWGIFNGLFLAMILWAVNGHEGAGRIVGFLAWWMGPMTLLAGMVPDACKPLREKGRSVPAWMSQVVGAAFIVILVFHGWINVAIAMLMLEVGEARIYSETDS